MVATGHTYDRVCIERWLQQGNRTCPVTGMRLRHLELTPNFALRNAIQVRLQFSMCQDAFGMAAAANQAANFWPDRSGCHAEGHASSASLGLHCHKIKLPAAEI